MARVIAFTNSAASITTVTWVVDRDCLLIGGGSTGGAQVISDDPAMTTALIAAPTETGVRERFIMQPGGYVQFPIDFLLLKDTKLFCAFSAAKGTAWMIVEDVEISPES